MEKMTDAIANVAQLETALQDASRFVGEDFPNVDGNTCQRASWKVGRALENLRAAKRVLEGEGDE